jgi:hypothetical protein
LIDIADRKIAVEKHHLMGTYSLGYRE